MTVSDADPLVPATIWRRVASAFYDTLLLFALWLSGTLLLVVLQNLLHLRGGMSWQHFVRIFYFLIGLLFFGWCWTHGGQTPGMKAWRLRLLREDGHLIRWPVAAVRYVAILVCWTTAALPVLAAVPTLRAHFPLLGTVGWIALALLVGGVFWTRFDSTRRSPQDRLTGTITMRL